MKLTEKIAYMRGLFDGMQLDPETKEGKAILHMAEIMGEMGDHIDKLESRVDELEELCDLLDEDLEAVEDDLYADNDDDDEDDDADYKRVWGNDADDDDDWDDDEDDDYSLGRVLPPEDDLHYDRAENDEFEELQYVVTCPNCKRDVSLSEYDLEEGSMDCPHCGQLLEFDYDSIEAGGADASDADGADADTEEDGE